MGLMTFFQPPQVTIFEDANFQGRSATFAIGDHRLSSAADMNELASSLKVPPGMVAVVYEHAIRRVASSPSILGRWSSLTPGNPPDVRE